MYQWFNYYYRCSQLIKENQMGFFSKVEQDAANALKKLVLDAKKLVEDADADVARLETELANAKQKAADLATKAKDTAKAAADTALANAEALVKEAESAAQVAADRAGKIAAPTAVGEAPVISVIPDPNVVAAPVTQEAQAAPTAQ